MAFPHGSKPSRVVGIQRDILLSCVNPRTNNMARPGSRKSTYAIESM
ncbi:MAG TPA: hypothetical protein VHZ74_00900 [Bryobacteraceae bacterium]|nr:hypothetical protein [Bryobacteraceae bacterium]